MRAGKDRSAPRKGAGDFSCCIVLDDWMPAGACRGLGEGGDPVAAGYAAVNTLSIS
jgi:hypothetical protein